jgi:hypothetical protein
MVKLETRKCVGSAAPISATGELEMFNEWVD